MGKKFKNVGRSVLMYISSTCCFQFAFFKPPVLVLRRCQSRSWWLLELVLNKSLVAPVPLIALKFGHRVSTDFGWPQCRPKKELDMPPQPQRQPAWLKSARSSWSWGIGYRMCMRCVIAPLAMAKMLIQLRWRAGPRWNQGPFGVLPKMFGPTHNDCWNEVWRCCRRQASWQWEARWKIWIRLAPNFMCRPHCLSVICSVFFPASCPIRLSNSHRFSSYQFT